MNIPFLKTFSLLSLPLKIASFVNTYEWQIIVALTKRINASFIVLQYSIICEDKRTGKPETG